MKKEDFIVALVYGFLCVVILLTCVSHYVFNSDWLDFYGSLIASAATIMAVLMTISQQRADMKEQNRMQNRPYIQLVFKMEEQRFVFKSENKVDEFCSNPKSTLLGLSLKNIGNGVAKDISFELKNDENFMKKYQIIDTSLGIETTAYKFGEHKTWKTFDRNNSLEMFFLEKGNEFNIAETGVEDFFITALFNEGYDRNFIKRLSNEPIEYSIKIKYKDIFENIYIDEYKVALKWLISSYDEGTKIVSYSFKVEKIECKNKMIKAPK